MPAIVVCAACQTKLKVPEASAAKALRCPKCKGTVPVAAAPKPKAPPPEEAEFEVNEAADDQEEEFEVNEAVDEGGDDEPDEDDGESDDAALVELGFSKGTDPFKKAKIPDAARKAIEKSFVKKEKALWAGKPVKEIVESKAWIGLIVGSVAILIGLSVCIGTGALAAFTTTETMARVITGGLGALFGFAFGGVGLLAIIFRKRIGGNVAASYVVTTKRAYIFDGSHAVRAFTPEQLTEMKAVESTKFPGAGDLVFAYDLMGDAGVQIGKESADRHGQHSTPVGFLAVDDLQLVRQMINEVLVEPHLDKIDAKAKAKKQKAKEKKRHKPFG